MIAIALQFCKVILKDRILPHASIHGGGYQLGRLGCQHGGGEHIVAYAVGKFSYYVSCTGSNHEEIASFGKRYVFYIEREVTIERIYNALVVSECLERHWGNEVSGILSHNDMHIGMELDQHRSQISTLVGSNTACYTQYYGLSCKHLTVP